MSSTNLGLCLAKAQGEFGDEYRLLLTKVDSVVIVGSTSLFLFQNLLYVLLQIVERSMYHNFQGMNLCRNKILWYHWILWIHISLKALTVWKLLSVGREVFLCDCYLESALIVVSLSFHIFFLLFVTYLYWNLIFSHYLFLQFVWIYKKSTILP